MLLTVVGGPRDDVYRNQKFDEKIDIFPVVTKELAKQSSKTESARTTKKSFSSNKQQENSKHVHQ